MIVSPPSSVFSSSRRPCRLRYISTPLHMVCLLPEMSIKIVFHLVNFKLFFKIKLNCCFICKDSCLKKKLIFSHLLPCYLVFSFIIALCCFVFIWLYASFHHQLTSIFWGKGLFLINLCILRAQNKAWCTVTSEWVYLKWVKCVLLHNVLWSLTKLYSNLILTLSWMTFN